MENAQNGKKSYNFHFLVKIGLRILKMSPYNKIDNMSFKPKDIDISVKTFKKDNLAKIRH